MKRGSPAQKKQVSRVSPLACISGTTTNRDRDDDVSLERHQRTCNPLLIMRLTAFPPPPPHPITLIFAPFAETWTTRLARCCRCVGFLALVAAPRNRRRSDTAVAPPRVNPLVRIVPAALIGMRAPVSLRSLPSRKREMK
jgi:hypothetical protein